MGYHIFHTIEDFNEQVKIYKSNNYIWIDGVDPDIKKEDFPVILNADGQKTMMFGIVNYYKERYFSDPEFMNLYKKSLRKYKFKKIFSYE